MTPYKRPDSPNYYIDLVLSDGRRLARSTGETSKRRARQIEATIRELDDRGRHDLLDALVAGEVSPKQVHAAKMSERLEGLLADIEDPPLRQKLDEYVRQSPHMGTKWAADKLRKVAPEGARLSWLGEVENLRTFLGWMREKGYAPGTERRQMAWISKMVRCAFGPERRNRLWRALQLREEKNERCAWLTPSEMAAVREIASSRMWALISTAAATGLRLGELLSITRLDVDLEHGLVRVRGGKSRSARRKVPIHGEPKETLAGWCRGLDDREKLWPELTNNAVWHRWDRYRKHLGLKTEEGAWFRFHDLRHHYAVYMARQGVPLTELRDLLGHSSLRMVERYALYTPPPAEDRFREAYRSMGLEREIREESQQSGQHRDATDREAGT